MNNDSSSNSKIYNLLKTSYDTVFIGDLNKAVDAATNQDYDAFFIDIAEGVVGFDFVRNLKKANNSSTNFLYCASSPKCLFIVLSFSLYSSLKLLSILNPPISKNNL